MNGLINKEERRLDCTQEIVGGRRVPSPLNSLLVLQQTSAALNIIKECDRAKLCSGGGGGGQKCGKSFKKKKNRHQKD